MCNRFVTSTTEQLDPVFARRLVVHTGIRANDFERESVSRSLHPGALFAKDYSTGAGGVSSGPMASQRVERFSGTVVRVTYIIHVCSNR